MDDHMESVVIQASYAAHWASAGQTPLVLLMSRSAIEVSSIVEGSLLRTDVTSQMLTVQVVFVDGPLSQIDTERGIKFMVMAVDGTVAGC